MICERHTQEPRVSLPWAVPLILQFNEISCYNEILWSSFEGYIFKAFEELSHAEEGGIDGNRKRTSIIFYPYPYSI